MFHYKCGRFAIIGVMTVLTVLVTATCNLQPVSTIRVKASPEVYLPLGAKQFDTRELFKKFEEEMTQSASFNSAGKTTANNTNGVTYRYTSPDAENPDQLRYLVHYPVQSFSFNIENYFGKKTSPGGTTALSRTFDTNIAIPAIAKTENYKIPTHVIHNKLIDTFNKEHEHKKLSVPAGITGTFPTPTVTVSFQGFRSITFGDASYLTISTNPVTYGSPQYRIREATLTASGKTITGQLTGGDARQVRFPLDGETIGNRLELSMQLEIDGGSGDIEIERKLSGIIKKAEGVDAELDDISLDSGVVEIPLPNDFQRATVGTGSMNLSLNQPDDWHNINMMHKTAVVQSGSGGLAINPASFTALGTAHSLAGQPLNNNPQVTYTPVFKVSLQDATYTYDPSQEVFADFAFSIESFASITLKNKDDFTKVQREPAPADMRDWIKSMDIREAVAIVTLQNGLPAGNEIRISLASDSFHIPQQEKPFDAQKKTEQRYQSTHSFSLDITPATMFDLTTKVLLPGHNGSEDTFTLQNIPTDSTLSISGNVDFTLDWTKLMVKADNQQEHTFPQNGFFSLSLISKLKNTNITWDSIPLYLYAGSASELFNDAAVEVTIGAKYFTTTQSDLTPIALAPGETHPLTPLPVNALPKDSKEFTGKIPKPLRRIDSLDTLINKYPVGFLFTYTFSMPNGVPITREQYETAKKENKDTAIHVDLLLEVPIGFTAGEGGGKLPLTALTGGEAPRIDLFGRDGILNNLPVEKQQVVLRELRLETELKNDTDFNPMFVIAAQDTAGATVFEKELSLATGQHSLKLNDEDLDTIKKISPFSPELYLKAMPGHHIIKKGKHLTVAIGAAAKTDIDIPLLGGSSTPHMADSSTEEHNK